MRRIKGAKIPGEVTGLILLCAGAVLFLALVSYTPKDLPDWFPLSHIAPPNDPPRNLIGPFGAILAGCSYFVMGAASYFLAAILLGYGAAKFFSNQRLTAKLPWVIAFIISGACLLELQPWFLSGWRRMMNIEGPGGWIGYWIGRRSLYNLIGPSGASILLLTLYLASLIFLTGLQPVRIIQLIASLPGRIAEWNSQRRLKRADEHERLAIQQKKLEREQRKLEKSLRRQRGAALPSPAPTLEEEEERFERPVPQIIDTAVTKPAEKKKFVPAEIPHLENYTLPTPALLSAADLEQRQPADPDELRRIQTTLIETLTHFGISVDAGDITKGPTITRYEVYPAKGVRVDKIVSLERDLARATRAERINILAPIPGKDTVGIEIANSRKMKVMLRELLESEDWHQSKARIPLALGKDVYGKTIIADLAQMPHCLVAGTTGSGKSVCINSMVASILFQFTPEQVRFIMIDPKVVEMQVYNSLPHLAVPVVTDPKKVLLALRYVIDEMENRYKIFAKTGVRNITSFNARPKPKTQKELDEELGADAAESSNGDSHQETAVKVPRDDELVVPDQLPFIIVIIDELADLMQTAPADVEMAIARITQMARAAGIHMIVATQTPRADVITGVIKANIPARIAFQVASKIDSRVILDENGADRLLGQGDMLYLPPGTSRMVRAQGVLVTDEEIRELVDFVAAQGKPAFDAQMQERLESATLPQEELTEEDEQLLQKCIDIMRQEKKASTSLFQRRLRLGYTRAARLVDILEQRGYVAPGEGARPREILKDLDAVSS